METRVYVVTDMGGKPNDLPDNLFINIAEKEGGVYTLEGFQKEFNNPKGKRINQNSDFIRFINTPSNDLRDIQKSVTNSETDIAQKFWELRGEHGEIILHTDKDIDEGSIEYIEARSSNGNTYDVIPLRVFNDGIEVLDEANDKNQVIGFLDLADIRDRMALVEMMINKVK